MNILLCNAGSSSLKCTLANTTVAKRVASATVDWAGKQAHCRIEDAYGMIHSQAVAWQSHADAVWHVIDQLEAKAREAFGEAINLEAVGHRIVHGGAFTRSVRVTPDLLSHLESLSELAPLQNPPGLAVLAQALQRLPKLPHIAVFDTAFHATLPPHAFTFPLPDRWSRDWGIRRYGFHGLNHAYCSQRAAEMMNQPRESLRLIICHLGHGCSAAAVRQGVCCDTTMGFTPLDGLMMATRSGAVDPGILVYVQRQHSVPLAELDHALNHESGLVGVSGVSADMREVLTAAAKGNPRAELAVRIYTYRIQQAVGALFVALGGVDALIFTAGVGEHSAQVRDMVCQGLGCLGVEIDAERNKRCTPDQDIATADSSVRVLVIAAREDRTMLDEVVQAIRTA